MLKNIKINPSVSIKEAMKYLDNSGSKCLLVINEKNKLIGTLTDGDIRRAILLGSKFTEKIEKHFCTNPFFLVQDKFSNDEALDLLISKNLDLIPIINSDNEIIDYLTWSKLGKDKKSERSLEEIPVIIMAGGYGKRLEPFTKILPKPLIPLNDKTIIEHIIDQFLAVKCKKFYVTTNYKAQIIKSYFSELSFNYNLNFIDEKEPLGTAGSLFFFNNKLKNPIFVTNCDIMIKTDYINFYNFHLSRNNDISLVASTKSFSIPYGSCILDSNGDLVNIKEKPSYDLLVNTGFYLINPNVLNIVPENQFFHFTDLIEEATKNKMKIGVYPVNEDSWIDIGHWVEYRKVVEKMYI